MFQETYMYVKAEEKAKSLHTTLITATYLLRREVADGIKKI